MKEPEGSRFVLEGLWQARMATALKNYQIAKAASGKSISLQTDAPHPDGTFGYRSALSAENAALAEFRRVVKVFSDLLVHGKMPPEE